MSIVVDFVQPSPLDTPVLFLVFNRIETTRKVFEAVRKVKPPRLYIAADGARSGKQGESETVKLVRDYVTENVDWRCEVKTLFRQENLGCRVAVSSAVDWFFEHEEQGIILEDDCLPSQSFFWYCEQLLDAYREDKRIMLVSGYNKQKKWKEGNYDYFFSNLGGIWGWASWRRAWKENDLSMSQLEQFTENSYFEYLFGRKAGRVRKKDIWCVYDKNIDTWDYQWGFSRHVNSGLACVPSVNLVSNIGCGVNSTHTVGKRSVLERHDISFPLKKNRFVVPDRDYDHKFLRKDSLYKRIKGRLL